MRIAIACALSLAAAGAFAQEVTPEQQQQEPRRPAIRVLKHPYDISSFYRSPRAAYGWAAFWTNGYGAVRPAPLRPYRRSIGENGDLFLAVPFLAPVGPISGAFFGY